MSVDAVNEVEGITASLQYLTAMLETLAAYSHDEEQSAALGCMEYAENIHERSVKLVNYLYDSHTDQ